MDQPASATDFAILINDFPADDGLADDFGPLDQSLRAGWIVT